MPADSITVAPADFSSVLPAKTLVLAKAGRAIAAPAEYTAQGELLKTIKGALKQIEDKRVSYMEPLLKLQREINKDAKDASADFVDAERRIKVAMVTYTNQVELARRQEQDRLDAIARKERERIDQLARDEQERAEKKARELRDQERAAIEAGNQREAERLAARAENVIEQSAAKVDTYAERSATVVAPIALSAAPKVAGVATREVWKFEIVNVAAIPRQYLAVDEAKIRRVVQALKADAGIPGVRVYSERQLAAGAA